MPVYINKETGLETFYPDIENSNLDVPPGSKPSADISTADDAQKEADKKDIIEGIASLEPNASITKGTINKFNGLGNIFSGIYRFTRCTHRINISSGFDLTVEVVKNELGGSKQSASKKGDSRDKIK